MPTTSPIIIFQVSEILGFLAGWLPVFVRTLVPLSADFLRVYQMCPDLVKFGLQAVAHVYV